ncbi:hypothetical protein BDN70DRAFT_923664 [Pholiota conissans]|uniref:Uncharacterized protein n=1 Tax=Pholiota conissans TaxID=109636 RepID=A0A9P5YU62_9AGAR|nr:hypothetical protein BDN70DRAFT_923664 [Pholiota conissans]
MLSTNGSKDQPLEMAATIAEAPRGKQGDLAMISNAEALTINGGTFIQVMGNFHLEETLSICGNMTPNKTFPIARIEGETRPLLGFKEATLFMETFINIYINATTVVAVIDPKIFRNWLDNARCQIHFQTITLRRAATSAAEPTTTLTNSFIAFKKTLEAYYNYI